MPSPSGPSSQLGLRNSWNCRRAAECWIQEFRIRERLPPATPGIRRWEVTSSATPAAAAHLDAGVLAPGRPADVLLVDLSGPLPELRTVVLRGEVFA